MNNKHLGSRNVQIWNRNTAELNALGRISKGTMTMHGVLHPKSDVDRIYMKRKDGGRSLIGMELCVRAEIHGKIWTI